MLLFIWYFSYPWSNYLRAPRPICWSGQVRRIILPSQFGLFYLLIKTIGWGILILLRCIWKEWTLCIFTKIKNRMCSNQVCFALFILNVMMKMESSSNIRWRQVTEVKWEKWFDTDRESMCYMHTKLNSNAHCHYKVHNRECIQLDIQNCHYSLHSFILWVAKSNRYALDWLKDKYTLHHCIW